MYFMFRIRVVIKIVPRPIYVSASNSYLKLVENQEFYLKQFRKLDFRLVFIKPQSPCNNLIFRKASPQLCATFSSISKATFSSNVISPCALTVATITRRTQPRNFWQGHQVHGRAMPRERQWQQQGKLAKNVTEVDRRGRVVRARLLRGKLANCKSITAFASLGVTAPRRPVIEHGRSGRENVSSPWPAPLLTMALAIRNSDPRPFRSRTSNRNKNLSRTVFRLVKNGTSVDCVAK